MARAVCTCHTCTCKRHVHEEEVAFYRRWLVAAQRATDKPPFQNEDLVALSPAVGYVLGILAATDAFYELFNPVPLAANERQRIEAFVLSTVESMLDIARDFPRFSFPEEKRCVTAIQQVLVDFSQRSKFLTTLRTRWTTAPFQAMLRARGLSNATAEANANNEQYKARRAADIAKHGLHPCGLPSCDKREATVKQFKYSGDCEEEWYCCAEHQVLHWQEHKPICRARTAAAAAAATVE